MFDVNAVCMCFDCEFCLPPSKRVNDTLCSLDISIPCPKLVNNV